MKKIIVFLIMVWVSVVMAEQYHVSADEIYPNNGQILIEISPGVFEWGDQIATSDPSVKYEVTFKVVYNAVTAERAAEISKEVMIKYQDACKVDVRAVKLQSFSSDGSDPTVTWTQSD